MDTTATQPVGEVLREWRRRRRLSQLTLAAQAGISSRHLSFVETGRARASREMLLKLAEHLEIPLRERNHLLLVGGFAPAYPQSPLTAPHMAPVREAVRTILAGHEPYPAMVVDRLFNVVGSNRTARAVLGEGVAPELTAEPANTLRISLHPDGFAPRIANLGEWRAHLLGWLRRQARLTGDPELARLHEELVALPCDEPEPEVDLPNPGDIAVPLRLRYAGRELVFFSTASVIGTPLDVTAAEIMIESFFPADAATREFLHQTRTPDGEPVSNGLAHSNADPSPHEAPTPAPTPA